MLVLYCEIVPVMKLDLKIAQDNNKLPETLIPLSCQHKEYWHVIPF